MYQELYARAQPLFCTLNLLFGDVPLAVAVVFCVRSLISLVAGYSVLCKMEHDVILLLW